MLKGELTNLRAIERADAVLIHGWLDDPELMRWWGYGATAVSRATALVRIEQWLEDERLAGHPVALVIQTLEGVDCGLAVLSDLQLNDRSSELSLFLAPAHRGRGLGGDALETIVDTAFQQWNLHRLTVRSEAHNAIAQQFFARHGFTLEGRLREARFIDGAWRDILVFGRLPHEEPEP